MSNFGRKIYRYKSLNSTNDTAFSLADKGAAEGTVILAEEQKKGRGKWKRRWISPPGGGIWMSIIIRPKLSSLELGRLTLMAAVAVVKALRNYPGLKAMIKWPNDILVRGKKIAGILIEMKEKKGKVEYVVIGVGINTACDLDQFPEELKNCVTSVRKEFTHRFLDEKLIKEIIKQIEYYYSVFKKESFSLIEEEWNCYSAVLGKYIEASVSGKKISGRAVGLSDRGYLLLRRDTGIIDEIFGSDIRIEME